MGFYGHGPRPGSIPESKRMPGHSICGPPLRQRYSHRCVSISDIRKAILTQPRNGLAWTLQERLFSRRILYFTEEQMISQCRSRFFVKDGLWVGNTNTIVTSLMWSPVRDSYDGMELPKPALANDGSPSWSWASLVAEVEHHLVEDDVIIVRQPSLDPEFAGEFVLRCWLHKYAGVRTYHELRKTAQVYDLADSYGDVTSSDPDSPRADPFADFDMTQHDDLGKPEGPALDKDNQSAFTQPQRRRDFHLAFIAYTNPFEREHADKAHAEQHSQLLGNVSNSQEHAYKQAGIAATGGGNTLCYQFGKWVEKEENNNYGPTMELYKTGVEDITIHADYDAVRLTSTSAAEVEDT
ncbi:hypothetical protein DL767_001322 [Monosporascus sp. MG133]|nr:hypothetical protein DL767_001322 [Monosporascus sp. MG133]